MTAPPQAAQRPKQLLAQGVSHGKFDAKMDSPFRGGTPWLDFQNHRHDQRAAGGALHNEAFQILADFFFNHSVVSFFLIAGSLQRLQHNLPRVGQEAIFTGGEAAHHNLGRGLHPSGELVDGNDGQHNAILTQVAAVANHQVLHHVGARARVNAHAAYRHASRLARAHLIELQDVAALDRHHLAHCALHGGGQFGVPLQLPELTVNGNEVARLHQVDNQLQLFLAGVAADVYRRVRAILVNNVGLAPEKVVNHAVDGLLVAGNDARGKHYRVSQLDLRVLVVIHRGARQRRHGLTLRAADEHAHLLRRKIFDLPGMNQQPIGHVYVAQVGGDLRRVGHGAPHQRHFPVVFKRQLERQLDAVNGRGEAGDEQAPLCPGEHLVELAPHRALTRRVAGPLDVGGILKQRQHSLLAVFGEGMQVEQPVIGGCGVHLEVAGVDDHAQRRVNGQRNAIHQTMRYLNRVNREWADGEALTRTDFAQIGVVQQPVLLQLVFHVSQGELGAIHRKINFGKNPRQPANVVFVPVGEHDGAHLLAVLDEVGDIGDNDVHAQQFGFGEHEAGVNDDDFIAPAHGHAVHAELAQAPQGHNL